MISDGLPQGMCQYLVELTNCLSELSITEFGAENNMLGRTIMQRSFYYYEMDSFTNQDMHFPSPSPQKK